MEERGSAAAVDSGDVEIDVWDIIDIIQKWWLRIVAIAVITALAGYFYAVYTYVPMYTTTAMMIVHSSSRIDNDGNTTGSDIALAQRMVKTCSLILRSDSVARLVVEDLGIDKHPNMIRAGISVVPAADGTEVINVIVRNSDPVLAADIANSLMKVAPDVIAETMGIGSVKVVDYAQVPLFPEPPRTMLNTAVGGVLGVMLGLGLAFFFNFMDNTVKNDLDIRNKLGLKLLGGVPIMEKGKSNKKKNGKDTPFIINDWVNPAFKEAYKAIRTNLFFSAENHNVSTIIVTSTLEKEGKTTVAINMAMVISQMGKSVLLVNCDLRKPSISEKLWLESSDSKGLSTILSGKYDVKDCIVSLPITNVDVLPSQITEDNPSELLGSEAMGKMLEELKEQYDYIILDTPPAHLVTDAAVLSRHADGIVFVIKQGLADIDLISTVVDDLSKLNINILGCILNCINFKKGGAHYKKQYYQQYYNDYYN